MCQASRSPHTATSTSSRIRRNRSPVPSTAATAATADETQTPRDVDDVVPADPPADDERDAVHHQHSDRQRRDGDDEEVHRRTSRRCEGPLVHIEIAGPEAGLGVGQVELPHPLEDIVETQRRHRVPALEEAFAPQPQRLGVVRAQRQHVHRAQPRVPLGDPDDRLGRRQQAAGEDVLLDPGIGVAGGQHSVVRHRDGLDRDPSARRHQPVEGLEVRRPEPVSHRLDHLHRHHGVVAAVDVAVVEQLDLHPVGQARRRRRAVAPAAAVRPTT